MPRQLTILDINNKNFWLEVKSIHTQTATHPLSLEDWELLSQATQKITPKTLTALQLVIILQNPLEDYATKLKKVKSAKVLEKMWRNLNNNQFPLYWITEPVFAFLCQYFTKDSWLHPSRMDNILRHMIKPHSDSNAVQLGALYYLWLLKYATPRIKKQLNTKETKYKCWLAVATIPNVNLTDYFTPAQIAKFWTQIKNNFLISDLNLSYEETHFYKCHHLELDQVVQSQKAPLELFSPLFMDTHQHSVDYTCIKFIRTCPNQPVREFLAEHFDTKSPKLINYLTSEVKSLANFLKFKPFLNKLKVLVENDWNLIWQILDSGSGTPNLPQLLADYDSVNNFKKLLTPIQWVIILKEISQAQQNLNSNEVEDLIREFKDTLRMVTNCAKDDENPLISKLHQLFRFNDYNTVAKLHEKVITLYNQVKQKEYPLNISSWLPDLEPNLLSLPNLEVIMPQTNTEMIIWGQKLNICVGSYAPDVQEGRTLVLGVKEQGAIKYCLEISTQGRLVQFKGKNNQSAPEALMNLAHQWITQSKTMFTQMEARKNLARYTKLQTETQKTLNHAELLKPSFPTFWKSINLLTQIINHNPAEKFPPRILLDTTNLFGFLNRYLPGLLEFLKSIPHCIILFMM
jgi:hypothetical protein